VTGERQLIAGRYRLISRLGSGAMGVVWQARDERLLRSVAIKQLLLPRELSDTEAEEANRRAMREARITARLHHPHAIAVYDVVDHNNEPFLIMEYLPSTSLATVLSRQGVLLPEAVARIGGQVSAALTAAHRVGIVHRDIKPGNVLLTDDGTAKITDFGVSHAVGEVTVTATGILLGTPAYLAPEVAQGHSADFASDVFSLGATLYTALEGTPPFGLNDNAIALLHQVASGQITPPQRAGPLTPLLLDLLQRNPEQRPTMQQTRKALAALAADLAAPPRHPPTPTLPLSRHRRTAIPTPTRPQTLIQTASLDKTTSPLTSTTVDVTPDQPPPRDEGHQGPRRRRRLVGLMAVVLLAAGVLVAALISHVTTGDNPTAHPSTSSGTAHILQPVPSQPRSSNPTEGSTPTIPPEPESPQIVPAAPESPQIVPAEPESPQIVPAVPESPQIVPAVPESPQIVPAVPESPQDIQEQPQQAIVDYYALMPENLSAGWERLTANYQQSHAGGFADYQNFWNAVHRVTVVDVSPTQDGSVGATIDYIFKDGRVVEERASYRLVTQDGLWKIDSSTVQSSYPKQGG
jgi:serine/threonine protein kinase